MFIGLLIRVVGPFLYFSCVSIMRVEDIEYKE